MQAFFAKAKPRARPQPKPVTSDKSNGTSTGPSTDAAQNTDSGYKPFDVHHYDSTRHSFPIVVTSFGRGCVRAPTTTAASPASTSLGGEGKHNSEDLPRVPYRSRAADVKTALHWGQRKLLLSEVQLLGTNYAKGFEQSYLIVYAGAAPGSHLPYLAEMFGNRHEWHLVDPGAFDSILHGRKDFVLENAFFTNMTAYRIKQKRIATGGSPALAALLGCALSTTASSTSSSVNAAGNSSTVVTGSTALDDEDDEDAAIPHVSATTTSSTVASNTTTTMATGAVDAAALQQNAKFGDLDAARHTTAIPTMNEPLLEPSALGGAGLSLLFDVAAERRACLFVSDVRSGTVAMPNFEGHVVENMKAQQQWTRIVNPDFAMLKFRLPYHDDKKECSDATTRETKSATMDNSRAELRSNANAATSSENSPAVYALPEYLEGDVLCPLWGPQTTTEGRLVVTRDARLVPMNSRAYEERMFFLNSSLREHVHFDHAILGHSADLDAHYDSAAEVHLWECVIANKAAAAAKLNQHLHPATSVTGDRVGTANAREEIKGFVERTTSALTETFVDVRRRRDALLVRRVTRGGKRDRDDAKVVEVTASEEAAKAGSSQALLAATRTERERKVWWALIDATSLRPSAGANAVWRCQELSGQGH